jgi:hypothetical protein
VYTVLGPYNVFQQLDTSIAIIHSRHSTDVTESLEALYTDKIDRLVIECPQGSCNVAFDFHDAVQDQLNFGVKMLWYSWDRMPGSQLFQDALQRYERFMTLRVRWSILRSQISNGSTAVLLPTIDLDLVWRTHLLSANKYQGFCQEYYTGIITHLASPATRGRGRNFQASTQVYEEMFDMRYELCYCWFCVYSRNEGRCNDISYLRLKRWVRKERRRRLTIGVPVLLHMADKQCPSCGWHPWKNCDEKYHPQSEKEFNGLPVTGHSTSRNGSTVRPEAPTANTPSSSSEYTDSAGPNEDANEGSNQIFSAIYY